MSSAWVGDVGASKHTGKQSSFNIHAMTGQGKIRNSMYHTNNSPEKECYVQHLTNTTSVITTDDHCAWNIWIICIRNLNELFQGYLYWRTCWFDVNLAEKCRVPIRSSIPPDIWCRKWVKPSDKELLAPSSVEAIELITLYARAGSTSKVVFSLTLFLSLCFVFRTEIAKSTHTKHSIFPALSFHVVMLHSWKSTQLMTQEKKNWIRK